MVNHPTPLFPLLTWPFVDIRYFSNFYSNSVVAKISQIFVAISHYQMCLFVLPSSCLINWRWWRHLFPIAMPRLACNFVLLYSRCFHHRSDMNNKTVWTSKMVDQIHHVLWNDVQDRMVNVNLISCNSLRWWDHQIHPFVHSPANTLTVRTCFFIDGQNWFSWQLLDLLNFREKNLASFCTEKWAQIWAPSWLVS